MLTPKHKPVVVAACIMHESNSFNAEPTRMSDFELRQGSTARSTLEKWQANNDEVAGFLDGAALYGFEFVPAMYAVATPGGPVTTEAFEELTNRLIDAIGQVPRSDGMLLALHGAMYTEAFPHADQEIVERVRAAVGYEMPLVVTHDFHANISPAMVEMTDALITYQQTPHIDMRQRGMRAAEVLSRMLKGEIRPTQALVKPQLLWNIVHHNTFREPLRSITQASMELEKQPGVLAASVACGYQYSDVPFIGPAVVVVTDDDEPRAQSEAQRLADMMWERREATRLNLPEAAPAVQAVKKAERFPVGLFDVGDNVGGGSPGDETSLLHELVKQKAQGWVVVLRDPEAVAAAKCAGIEGKFDMEVGGKSAATVSKPERVRGRVRSLHEGTFMEPEIRHGGRRYWSMGHSAVIEQQDSTPDRLNLLLITSERCCPFSLHQLLSCGIYPERQSILSVKGTVAPRAAYEPVCASIVLVDTPGITSVNPKRFRFTRVRPGIWDIDRL